MSVVIPRFPITSRRFSRFIRRYLTKLFINMNSKIFTTKKFSGHTLGLKILTRAYLSFILMFMFKCFHHCFLQHTHISISYQFILALFLLRFSATAQLSQAFPCQLFLPQPILAKSLSKKKLPFKCSRML